MKKILLSLLIFTSSLSSFAITYYYNGSLALNALADVVNWGQNTDGSAGLGRPTNFTSGDIFIICNIQATDAAPTNNGVVTLSTTWTVSGAGSKIVVGNGIGQVRFNISTGAILTATVDIVDNTNSNGGGLYRVTFF